MGSLCGPQASSVTATVTSLPAPPVHSHHHFPLDGGCTTSSSPSSSTVSPRRVLYIYHPWPYSEHLCRCPRVAVQMLLKLRRLLLLRVCHPFMYLGVKLIRLRPPSPSSSAASAWPPARTARARSCIANDMGVRQQSPIVVASLMRCRPGTYLHAQYGIIFQSQILSLCQERSQAPAGHRRRRERRRLGAFPVCSLNR